MIKLYRLSLFCLPLLFGHCSLDNDEPQDDSDIIDIGSFSLLESNLDMMPYKDVSSLIFMNADSITTKFTINEQELRESNITLFNYDVNVPGDTVLYGSKQESKRWYLDNSALNLRLDLRLTAKPYHPDPTSGAIADVTEIYFQTLVNSESTSQVFWHLLDQRTWEDPLSETNFSADTIILGQSFQNVYHTNFVDPESIVHFSYDKGVVSFTDLNGQLWRLEDVE